LPYSDGLRSHPLLGLGILLLACARREATHDLILRERYLRVRTLFHERRCPRRVVLLTSLSVPDRTPNRKAWRHSCVTAASQAEMGLTECPPLVGGGASHAPSLPMSSLPETSPSGCALSACQRNGTIACWRSLFTDDSLVTIPLLLALVALGMHCALAASARKRGSKPTAAATTNSVRPTTPKRRLSIGRTPSVPSALCLYHDAQGSSDGRTSASSNRTYLPDAWPGIVRLGDQAQCVSLSWRNHGLLSALRWANEQQRRSRIMEHPISDAPEGASPRACCAMGGHDDQVAVGCRTPDDFR
jgi:hypothetical protein